MLLALPGSEEGDDGVVMVVVVGREEERNGHQENAGHGRG